MTSDDLCNFAESRGYDVDFLHLQRFQACTVEVDQRYGIAVDYKQSEQEKKAHLAHELGHCEYAGLYQRHTPYELKSRIEYRADKWAFVHILPYWKIKECFQQGATEAWEIAEMVDLPEWFVKKAVIYYQSAIHQR